MRDEWAGISVTSGNATIEHAIIEYDGSALFDAFGTVSATHDTISHSTSFGLRTYRADRVVVSGVGEVLDFGGEIFGEVTAILDVARAYNSC